MKERYRAVIDLFGSLTLRSVMISHKGYEATSVPDAIEQILEDNEHILKIVIEHPEEEIIEYGYV